MTGSADRFLAAQVARLQGIARKKRIVFPEGRDSRIQEAADRLQGLLEPILLTSHDALNDAARMVASGEAHGGVGGAVNTTAETARAAFQNIGMEEGIRRVSGVFFVCVRDSNFGHNGVLAFADCAMMVDPSADEIGEIAIATARSVRMVMDVEPSIALLSFSTKGSAKDHKMIEALKLLRERAPSLVVDGELQADAALVPSIGQSKAPGSTVAGRANTLIFPNLASANIGYKLVERLGGARAFGPFLQGLKKPFNDLSRGCSVEDIFGAAVITALQSEDSTVASL
jgi:phosphate acetyltransferase